jgi:hypothetical protein
MKIKTLDFFGLSMMFLISCSTNNIDCLIEYELNEPKTLNGKEINISNKLLRPKSMSIIDNKLLVFDDINEGIFNIYDLANFKNNFTWGRKGNGPDEFQFIDDNYFRSFKNQLELIDNGKLKVLTLEDSSFNVETLFHFDRSYNLNRLQKVTDTIYFLDNNIEDDTYEHVMIDLNSSNIIKYFGSYPENHQSKLEPHIKYQVYQKFNVSNIKSGKFVTFYQFLPLIKIYSIHGNIICKIMIKDNESVKLDFVNLEKNSIQFVQPYATEDFIYVLKINMNEEKIFKEIDNIQPSLLKLNWDGVVLKHYKLDKFITRFAISENSELYATSMLNENIIYKFSLDK